jgi:hypothetical protein
MLCINAVGQNRKMYAPHELRNHNAYHEMMSARVASVTATTKNNTLPVTEANMEIPGAPSVDVIKQLVQNDLLIKHYEYYKALKLGSAMCYLVTRQFQAENYNEGKISPMSAELHTLIGFISQSQSKLENAKFARLLKLIDTQNKEKLQIQINQRNYFR